MIYNISTSSETVYSTDKSSSSSFSNPLVNAFHKDTLIKQPKQYYFCKNNKIYYNSKYNDNYVLNLLDSIFIRDLRCEYPYSNIFGIDTSRNTLTKVIYNAKNR